MQILFKKKREKNKISPQKGQNYIMEEKVSIIIISRNMIDKYVEINAQDRPS